MFKFSVNPKFTRVSIFILGKICCVVAVAFAYFAGVSALEASQLTVPTIDPADIEVKSGPKQETPRAAYDVIANSPVFSTKAAPVATTVAEGTTKLSLRLVATYVTEGRSPLAIIEDTAKKEQRLYGLPSDPATAEQDKTVFNQAELVKIAADSVTIKELNSGQLKNLYLDDKTPTTASAALDGGLDTSASNDTGDDQTNFTLAEAEVSEALANLPLLLSQARAVPYFRNGQSVGMRLFAIRRGSMYEKIGLKNGDIIKTVNETSLSDPTQALKIFEQLKNERSLFVNVERNGRDVRLDYSIR